MLKWLKNTLAPSVIETNRMAWLEVVIGALPKGGRLLDAGAGELRNKIFCQGLNYVSQDFCQYNGIGDGSGLHTGIWDTKRIDLVCDICNIPEQGCSFDAVVCTEVLEHVPDPLKALDEFARLIKPGGRLILTTPFISLVHFAPYHFSSGFSRYWYERHLADRGFNIVELSPNGDWFDFLRQELSRLPLMAKKYNDRLWPLAYLFSGIALIYFILRKKEVVAHDVACLGWLCVAEKI